MPVPTDNTRALCRMGSGTEYGMNAARRGNTNGQPSKVSGALAFIYGAFTTTGSTE